MKRRFLPLLLILSLLVALFVPTSQAALSPFQDVSNARSYYYAPVQWAVEAGITNGTSATAFSPDKLCSRAEVVTFLWRAAGKPAPAAMQTTFTDIRTGTYYYDAVLWAVQRGITDGTSETTFSPDHPCTRAQAVTFLWRWQSSPTPISSVNPFRDVAADSYYHDAVLWAVEAGVTTGVSATTFSPNETCTRGHFVTFLYRAEDAGVTQTPASASLYYKDQAISVTNLFYRNGRLFLDQSQLEAALGKPAQDLPFVIPPHDGHISLIDAVNLYDLSVCISQADHRIDFYDAAPVQQQPVSGSAPAYLRLEDVTASGLDSSGNVIADDYYSSKNLEKLRFMAQHMYNQGSKFYIAWIPVYVNPTRGVINDVAQNPCLYNADFIFTLDYLRLHGGYIVLHGYTHQEYDTVSGDGNEFDKNSEYTAEQMSDRMDLAILAAKALGYECDYFEFPHYAYTDVSRTLAEAKFDVIYQGGVRATQKIETVTVGTRTVTYIPTPPDYVYSRYDSGLWDRLDTTHAKGQTMSLFYHPRLDFGVIQPQTVNGVRQCSLSQEVILVKVLDHIHNLGYSFQHYN